MKNFSIKSPDAKNKRSSPNCQFGKLLVISMKQGLSASVRIYILIIQQTLIFVKSGIYQVSRKVGLNAKHNRNHSIL